MHRQVPGRQLELLLPVRIATSQRSQDLCCHYKQTEVLANNPSNAGFVCQLVTMMQAHICESQETMQQDHMKAARQL